MKYNRLVKITLAQLLALAFMLGLSSSALSKTARTLSRDEPESPDQVLEWNQIFVDTLVATNTANSSSQRLGAIVHTAVFDAYNGIERRYTPVFYHNEPPKGASRRAAVIAAAYTALDGLFPARHAQLTASYEASLAALSDDGGDGERDEKFQQREPAGMGGWAMRGGGVHQ